MTSRLLFSKLNLWYNLFTQIATSAKIAHCFVWKIFFLVEVIQNLSLHSKQS